MDAFFNRLAFQSGWLTAGQSAEESLTPIAEYPRAFEWQHRPRSCLMKCSRTTSSSLSSHEGTLLDAPGSSLPLIIPSSCLESIQIPPLSFHAMLRAMFQATSLDR